MSIKLYLLDYIHVGGNGAITTLNIPLPSNGNQNDFIYFCGLIIALLIQLLIINDFFVNYVSASPYLIWSRIPEIKYIVKFLGLKSLSSSSLVSKHYWPVALSILSMELSYSLIQFYYYEKSLLYISVVLWSLTFFESLLSITLINIYLRNTEDLKIALRIREKRIYYLEREIRDFTPLWQAEELKKHGVDYNENFLNDRIVEYRNSKMRVINEIINMKDNYAIEILQNLDIEYDGTLREWFQTLTQQNSINIILYFYYLFVCSKDSQYIYDIFCILHIIAPTIGYRSSLDSFKILDRVYSFMATLDPLSLVLFQSGWKFLFTTM